MTDRLDGSIFGPDQPCFGCAPDHPTGFRLTFERTADEVVTRFVPSERHQGPPGIMHGGLVAALADELGAWVVIALSEKFGFTAEMSGKLRKPIRVGREVVGRGRVQKGGARVVTAAITLEQDGAVAYEGTVKLVVLDEAGAERMLGAPLPDAWKRFGR